MRAFVPSLVALLVGTGCGQRPVDVVFITVDTLRYDHVSALDPDSPAKTPNIDLLASEGVVYTQAYSPISVTGPAFCSLLTGLSPGTHGVVMNVFRGGNKLQQEVDTLPELLRRQGYHTGAFVSGFTLRRSLGIGQGFDRYSTPTDARRPGGETAEMMWAWLATQPGPIFAWWHSYDPHGPLDVYDHPPITRHVKRGGDDYHRIPEYQRIGRISDRDFFAGRYATAVEYADEQVGRVYDVLHAAGRWDDALIVITADHGESFDERELWFDHGTTAYEEQLHVPLIIRYPRGEGGGRVVDALVMLEDVMPTVLDALGMAVPGGLDGVSLFGDDIPKDRQITGESSHCKGEEVLSCAPKGPGGKMYAVRTDDRTTVRRASTTGVSYERYDREADRGELSPLQAPAHARPSEDTGAPPPPVAWDDTDAARIQTLDGMYDVRAVMKLGPGPPKKESEETEAEKREREALEQLGYLDQ